jgi:hypothetical protein
MSIYTETITSELSIAQLMSYMGPIYVTVDTNLQASASDIDPNELINVDVYDEDAVAALLVDKGLRQNISLNMILSISVESQLGLGSFVKNAIPLNYQHILNITDSVEIILHETVESQLNITQAVEAWVGYEVASVLNLTQNVTTDGVIYKSVSNSLSIESAVSYFTFNYCSYNLGVTPPTLIRRNTTILYWPYTSSTLELELRNPNFDNVEQFEPRRINRRTRGGDLEIYSDYTWPSAQRLIFSFTNLSEATIVALLNFIHWSLGQEIKVLDFESREWKGIILTPSEAISEPNKTGFSAGFELEVTG